MKTSSRRSFLKTAGAGTLSSLAIIRTSHAAPSDTIRHAVIGLGGQGRTHARTLSSLDGCEIVAVCDLDPERLQKHTAQLPNRERIRQEKDFRKILDDKSIDTVSIATPDHWHAPVALAAIQAGKHVYVEKPCSHNIREAVLLKQAAEDSGLCVQQGTQARSCPSIHEAVAFMRDGGLGKIRMAKAINHQLRKPIGRAPETDPPPGVDYDMWLGPAPIVPFTRNRWHYNWHWFWDYGCGDMGNDGIHQVDQARWGLGVGIPNAVTASGGQLFYEDDHETPDTQIVTFEYDDCYLLYEMRLWTDYKLEGHDNGVVFYGDDGKLEIGRNGCDITFIDGKTRHIGPYADIKDHFRNFLDCAKAGTPDKLHAPMKEAMPSTALCHLGNIATRLGRKITLDPQKLTCTGDPEAEKMFAREYRKGYELPI